MYVFDIVVDNFWGVEVEVKREAGFKSERAG